MHCSFDAHGEVLMVTGGANGIGAAVAAGFADAGGRSVVLDVDTPAEAASGVDHMAVDVSDRGALRNAVETIMHRHGRVDHLVAAAAVQPRTPVADMSPEEWQRVMAVNLNGVMWACQAVLPVMRTQQRGSIVLFASGLATSGRAEASAYAASKGAAIPFAKSLADEVTEDGIRVNIIHPGVVDTPQFRAANPYGGEREFWERTTGVSGPNQVVGSLLFLLSDAATMTGSTLQRQRPFRHQGVARPCRRAESRHHGT